MPIRELRPERSEIEKKTENCTLSAIIGNWGNRPMLSRTSRFTLRLLGPFSLMDPEGRRIAIPSRVILSGPLGPISEISQL
jgi:hypothetical protein